ncbi:MAG TPA: tyrosine-type recombinase/integrase, partial [Ignavibacteriaceae bacterium]|nr:tyrosine-type recombinase/integrase [Ignavibacteriaceae bacterium]
MFITMTKKSPYWQVVYHVNGKPTSISTKKKSESEAIIFMHEFKKKMNQPEDQIVSVKFSRFTDEYRKYISSSRTKSYLRSVNLSLNQFNNIIGDVFLNQISSRLIDQFISDVYSRSPYAAKLYYATLKAAFSKAINWNYIQTNPFKKLKAPKVPKSFPVFINEDELISILNNTPNQMLKDIFIMAYYTGMRLGEILNMKWNWISLPHNVITIKNSVDFKSKSKRERIIPI